MASRWTMWWDVASVSCLSAALYLRFRWGDRPGGMLFAQLSAALSTWSSYRRRWRHRAESEA
jgi:hypothetical protein